MKTSIVRMIAFALMAFALLAVSCKHESDDTPDNMAEVIGQGELRAEDERGDCILTVVYCKMEDKTFGIVGEDPMFIGELLKFTDDAYTYAGEHSVSFPGKPDPVVLPIYVKNSASLYYLYLERLGK